MDATTHSPAAAHATKAAYRSAEAFRAAKRHSRLVRLLKILVPAAILAIVGVFAVIWLAPLALPKLPFSIDRLNVDGQKVTMENPKLAGVDGRKRAYSVRAVRATQDLKATHLVDLEELTARFDLADNNTADLSAKTGRFDTKTQTLDLTGAVEMRTTNGQVFKSDKVRVDIKAGAIDVDSPVELVMSAGIIKANGMAIRDHGQVVTFSGGVDMVFSGGREPPAGPAPAEPPPQQPPTQQ